MMHLTCKQARKDQTSSPESQMKEVVEAEVRWLQLLTKQACQLWKSRKRKKEGHLSESAEE